MIRCDTLSLGRAPAIACEDLAGCFADRPVVFAEARDDQLGRRAVQRDLPAVAIDRLDGDATLEGAELCIGLAGSRVVAFGFVAHDHALPAGVPALPASRAPMSLAFRFAKARSPSSRSGYSEGCRGGYSPFCMMTIDSVHVDGTDPVLIADMAMTAASAGLVGRNC
jgi:hypothetical protein